MEELPFEIFEIIISYVDIYDLLSLRLVSKRLNLAIKKTKIDELLILNSKYDCKFNWSYSNKPINYKNIIHLRDNFTSSVDIKLLTNSSILNLANLKRLKIDPPLHQSLDYCGNLELFSKFDQLEVLELDLCVKSSAQNRLSLPNLKILVLKSFYRNIFNPNRLKLEINAPNLVSFGIYNYNRGREFTSYLTFNHPSSIKHLRISFYDPHLSILKNVEHLEIKKDYKDAFKSLLPGIFKSYGNLKQLEIPKEAFDLFRYDPVDQILNLKERFDKPDLKIYVHGFLLSTNFSSSIFAYLKSINSNLMSNYLSLVNSVNWIKDVDYNSLMSMVNEIPDDFFKKFNLIQSIEITGKVQNQNHLIQFIGNCSNLCKLKIYNSNLDQSFYDRLPEIKEIVSLNYLDIKEDSQTSLNLSFIIKMLYVREITTNFQLPIDILSELDNFRYLNKIEFKINSKSISIEKKSRGRYVIRTNYESRNITGVNDLVAAYRTIESKN